MTSARRRVAVTGMGVVAPCGIGVEAFWRGLFRAPAPGEQSLAGWEPTRWLDARDAKRTDRFAQLAVASADMAVSASGWLDRAPRNPGVVIATALGGVRTYEEQVLVLDRRGERRVSPYLIPMFMGNAAAATVSMRLGWRGPCEIVLTACAAGTHAIGYGARLVGEGSCDVVVAGGAESASTPAVTASFRMMRALSPSGRLRPFDADRDGFVISEAAAALVLEDYEGARRRSATIHGEVIACGSTADAHDITAPPADGGGAALCMRQALAAAGIGPADVRQINAHGTGTRLNDAAEACAIASVFGPSGPPVTSTKGATGHAFGATGALEAVAVLLSMRHVLIPPTLGLERRDALCEVDVVPHGRPWAPGPAISNSFGFGGHNACLVLGPP